MDGLVLGKIVQFYTTNDNSLRPELETFLKNFQKSPDAWKICKQLLENENLPYDVAFYAHPFIATALSNKIIFQLNELDEASLDSLKEFLLNRLVRAHLLRKSTQAHYLYTVVNQLSSSIANLAIANEKWIDVIPTLISKMSEQWPDLLLTLLTQFPAEYDTLKNKHSFVVSKERLDRFEASELAKYNSFVFQLVDHSLEKFSGDSSLVSSAIKCFNSWIENIEHFHIQPEIIDNMKLIDFVLMEFLKKGPLFSEFYGTILNIIKYMKDTRIYKSVNTFNKIFSFLQQIKIHFVDKMINTSENNWNIGDMEKVCNLLTTACRSFIDVILECNEQSLYLLHVTLECLKMPDRESNNIVAEFLLEFFTELDFVYKTSDPEQRKVIQNIVYETTVRLISCCCVRENDLDGDCYDELFTDLRETCFTIYCCFGNIIGYDELLTNTVFKDFNFTLPLTLNPLLESNFLALSSFSKSSISVPNFQKIVYLVNNTLTKESVHYHDMALSLNMIIANVSRDQNMESQVSEKWFEFMVWEIDQIYMSNQKNRLSSSISCNFETLCYANKSIFSKNISGLVSLFPKSVMFTKREHQRRFINSICHPLSFVENKADLDNSLSSIFQCCLSYLQKPNATESDFVTGIEGIAYVVQTLDVRSDDLKCHLRQNLSMFLGNFWKFHMESLILNYYKNQEITEALISKLCKNFVRNFPETFIPFVDPILQASQKIMLNEQIPSSFVYLASIFVEQYSDMKELLENIIRMFASYFIKEMDAIFSGDVKYSDNTIFLIEDFYRLCYKYFVHYPDGLFRSDQFEKIFVLATNLVKINDYATYETIIEFLRRVINAAVNKKNKSRKIYKSIAFTIVGRHLQNLILNIIKCLTIHESKFIYHLSDPLYGALILDKENTKKCIYKALQSEVPNASGNIKENFVNEILKSKSSDEISDALDAFHGVCQLQFINK